MTELKVDSDNCQISAIMREEEEWKNSFRFQWPEWKIIEKKSVEGSFGKVYKAQRIITGKTFYSAIKVITIPSSQERTESVSVLRILMNSQ